jgi:hypothetical protein
MDCKTTTCESVTDRATKEYLAAIKREIALLGKESQNTEVEESSIEESNEDNAVD